MIGRTAVLAATVLAAALLAVPCRAQETGSSFGGGDWGGSSDFGGSSSDFGSSSSDFGSSSSDYGSSDYGSSDYGSSDYGSSGGGGGDILGFFLGVGLVGVLIAVFVIAETVNRQRRERLRGMHDDQSIYGAPAPRASSWGRVDVTALRIAIDWRARRYVQERLDALARSGKTGSKAGLVELLRSAAALLSSVRLAWLYGGVTNRRPMQKSEAQATFTKLGVDARSRFRRELVRAEDGAATEGEAGPLAARAEEGPGVVVVTVVVAATRELLDIGRPSDANELEAALEGLRKLGPSDLVALEVVWSPSAEDDRMSTAELEALYADLVRLDEASVGGRVFCGYCAGPYAEELGRCPHCGAPAERAVAT